MESYHQRKEKNIKETITTKYPINKVGINTDNRRTNHASKYHIHQDIFKIQI